MQRKSLEPHPILLEIDGPRAWVNGKFFRTSRISHIKLTALRAACVERGIDWITDETRRQLVDAIFGEQQWPPTE